MSDRDGQSAVDRPVFTVEPWCVREPELRLDRLAQTESVFALSNGHLGMRGNLDEGEPHGLPGTYLNSFYEQRPLPHAETAYGYPESGQTAINVTNGKVIRLLVDDEPLDVRYGRVHHHERVLDMRAGTLTRQVEWTSPADRTIRVTSVRMVSLTQRAVAAICYEVEPVDEAVRVVAQSELVANEALPGGGKDPRASAILDSPLVSEEHVANGKKVLLLHRTRRSGLRMAAGMSHDIEGPESLAIDTESSNDVGRLTVATRLEPGQRLRIVKYIAYGWSSRGPGRRCTTRWSGRWRARGRPAGTGCWPSSASTSTTSGRARTSRSRATPRSSRRSGSGCSTSCRPGRGRSAA